jgi:hypothetical protein
MATGDVAASMGGEVTKASAMSSILKLILELRWIPRSR